MNFPSTEEVIIASNFAPTYHGGLATYQKTLARVISERTGKKGAFLWPSDTPLLPARSDAELPWPAYQAEPRWITKVSRPYWPRLASRPWTHGLLDSILAGGWREPAFRPRAVHFVGRGWDFFGFAAQALASKTGAKFTVWPASHPKESGDDVIDLRLYGMADAVFCQSRFEADYLISLGLDAGKVRLGGLPPMCLSNGDGEALRKRLDLGGRPVVYFLGRGTEDKGYPALLAAWPIVLKRIPEAVLLLAGPGTGDDLPATMPAKSRRNLGIIDESCKADAYAACDVFCLPSAHESFGIVYVEAWSYGKPVICGTALASRELVEDGKTGLWADQNPETLAEKLVFLLSNSSDAQRMGEAGLKRQGEMFTEDEMLKVHLKAWGLSS